MRTKVQDKLTKMLQRVNSDPVGNMGKLWIYEHLVVAKLSWKFTIYTFPITFAKHLQTMAKPFLKKWAGVTRSANNTILFRSRNKGGLNTTSLDTKLKCAQLVKFHQLKYSIAPSTQLIYGHIANRL